MKKLFISLFFLNICFASVPTMEGLFRNPGNKPPGTPLAYIQFTISTKLGEELKVNEIDETAKQSVEKLLQSEEKATKHYKLFIEKNENKKFSKAFQIEYNHPSLKNEYISNAVYLPKLELEATPKNDPVKAIFYSLIHMLSFNDSNFIGMVLKNISSDFTFNKEVVNEELWNLLNSYKTYLIRNKGTEKSMSVPSPLDGSTPEERAKIKEVLDQPFYKMNKSIKLVRNSFGVEWNLHLERFDGNFYVSNLRPRVLKIELPQKTLNFYFDRYFLINSEHFFPRKIIIQAKNDLEYEVVFKKLIYLDPNRKSFNKRWSEYKEKWEVLKQKDKLKKDDFKFYFIF